MILLLLKLINFVLIVLSELNSFDGLTKIIQNTPSCEIRFTDLMHRMNAILHLFCSPSTLYARSEHVLVFLTGKDEIESAAKVLHRKAMSQDSS